MGVPVEFLGSGNYQANIYSDDLAAKYEVVTRRETVTAKTEFMLTLAPAGVAPVRLSLLSH